MRRLVSTLGLDKKDWLKYRKQGITGTDVGAITGMNPYVSAFAVYQDKLTENFDEFDNESMRQGRDLEEYVAKRFTEQTGKKVRRANAIFQNEKYPFMLADFDRLIDGEKAGLECKTVSPYMAEHWKDGHIPLHYQMQVQHYLAVSGFTCWYVAALIYGREFIVQKIERDEELINYLITIEQRFWKENILGGQVPDPDGTKKCSQMIAEIYFKADKEKSIQLYGFKEVLERRSELDQLIKKLETEKETIDQKIKLEMQDASYAVADEFKVSWTAMETQRLDTKKLKTEQPEIYEKYCKCTSSRRFSVSRAA